MSPTFSHRCRKLPWPCSRIERDVLHSLWLEAQATEKPITEIIKAAVDAHLEQVLNTVATERDNDVAVPAA